MVVFLPVFAILVLIAFIDYHRHIIPNFFLLILAIYGWIFGYRHLESSITLCVMMLALKILMERKMGKKCLGWGDVKLITVCGLFLEMVQIGPFLTFAGLIGIITSCIQRGTFIPFAPSIGLSFLLTHLLWRGYFSWNIL